MTDAATTPPLVLIAEDDPEYRDLLSEILGDLGCRLDFAENGDAAVAKALAHPPDLLLLDVRMPGRDGFTVCRELRAQARTAEVPILMMTGHQIDSSAREGLTVGADDVLAKPFRLSEFRLRVQTILRLNRYRLLQSERESFRWVIDQSQAGYVLLADDGTLRYANEAAQRLLKLPTDETARAGIALAEHLPQHFNVDHPERLRHLAAEATELSLVRPENADQAARWLAVRSYPPAAGEHAAVVQVRDVSDATHLTHAIWTFENLVSHKLRTSLNGLLGAVELLTEHPGDLGAAEREEFAGMAREAAGQLRDVVTGILDHTLTPAREQPLEGTVGKRLPPLVRAIADELGLAGHTCVVSPDTADQPVRMSEGHLLFVLTELLRNAVKFHPHESPRVSVELTTTDTDRVLLTVRDDGRHVPAEQLEQLTIPYFQGGRSFTGETPGMGLGLAKVASLARTYGGSLRVTNRSDRPGLVVAVEV